MQAVERAESGARDQQIRRVVVELLHRAFEGLHAARGVTHLVERRLKPCQFQLVRFDEQDSARFHRDSRRQLLLSGGLSSTSGPSVWKGNAASRVPNANGWTGECRCSLTQMS